MTHMTRRSVMAAMGTGVAWLALAPGRANAQQKTLRFSTYLPSQHPMMTQFVAPFADAVAEETGGAVQIEIAAAALAPPPRQFDMVTDGLANMSFTTHSYTPGRFPLTGIAELPFLGNSAEAMSEAYWDVHEKYLAAAGEHKGIKLLALSTHGPGALWTSKGPIGALSDLSGQKLIVPGGLGADIGAALGVVTVQAPAPQWYELLSRGTADGALFSVDAPMKFNLEDFLKHYTRVPGGLFNNSFAFFMSERDWDGLGVDNQAAIAPLIGKPLSKKMGIVWDAGDRAAIARFPEKNITVTDVEGPFLAEIRMAVAPVEQGWIKLAEEKGVDGAAALAMFRERAAEYAGNP